MPDVTVNVSFDLLIDVPDGCKDPQEEAAMLAHHFVDDLIDREIEYQVSIKEYGEIKSHPDPEVNKPPAGVKWWPFS